MDGELSRGRLIPDLNGPGLLAAGQNVEVPMIAIPSERCSPIFEVYS